MLVQQGEVILAQGRSERRLGSVSALSPAAAKVPTPSALLAAVACAWALDISPELLAAGLKTFVIE